MRAEEERLDDRQTKTHQQQCFLYECLTLT